MKNTELVSIIIPVYNSELYLNECLNSVMNQTYNNFECLLINDGSTDNSKEICESYCREDNRFILINKKNEGVSKTRNVGIENAKGKFIQFTDSDDILDVTFLEKMINEIITNQSDCVVCGIKSFSGSTKNIVNHWTENKSNLTKSEFRSLIKKWTVNPYIGGPYNKLFKREIINNNCLKYEVNQNYAEDFVFNILYYDKVDKITIIPDELYSYRRSNPTSLSKMSWNINEYIRRSENISHTLQETLIEEKNAQEIIIEFNYDLTFRILKKFHSQKMKILKEFLNTTILIQDNKKINLINKHLIIFKSLIEKKYYSLAILYVRFLTLIYLKILALKSFKYKNI